MKNPLLPLALSAALLAGSEVAHAAAPYRVIKLGTLGGDYTQVRAINNLGQVTGFSLTSDGAEHAFVYNGGVMSDISPVLAHASIGLDINDLGQVLGHDYFVGRGWQTFVQGGGTLSYVTGLGEGGRGYSINNLGQVTGNLAIKPWGFSHAFLYSGGVVQDLGTLGGYESNGVAINNLGQVAGSSMVVAGEQFWPAFVYGNGQMTRISPYHSGPSSINDAGQVTGSADPQVGSVQAFLYSGGDFQLLGVLPGRRYSYGTGINKFGVVVGYSADRDGLFSHGFVYKDGAMTDLNLLLDPVGGGGWTITEATGVNDRGQIIGKGYDAAGDWWDALLLSPVGIPIAVPEPASYGLMLAGLCLVGGVARRRRS